MGEWETGSEFHYGCLRGGGEQTHPWTKECVYGGSGRDVIRSLIRVLCTQGVKRMLLPSYFCHEVVQAASDEISVERFPDLPQAGSLSSLEAIDFEPGDAVLLVNQWGVRARADVEELRGRGFVVIEDHTHDPWSTWAYQSQADYCVASLRKCLPIPDGGVVWSPLHRVLPEVSPLTDQRQCASHEKLSAMLLKSAYLNNDSSNKELYRTLFQSGEAMIGVGSPSGMSPLSKSLLASLDSAWWRSRREENIELLERLLRDCSLRAISTSDVPDGHVPLGALFQLPSLKMRNELRAYLIQQSIFPAVLWPMDGGGGGQFDKEREVSERMLFLHVDGRYAASDIERMADALLRWAQPSQQK